MEKVMADLKVVPFVNMFGQTINPGEDIIYAGTSWKSTTFRKGKFVGAYYQNVSRSVVSRDIEGNIIKDERGHTKYDLVTEYKPVAVKIEQVYGAKWVYNHETKKGDYIPHFRVAVLPRMRVFRLDAKMSDLENSSF
jgi:hypothetical protein